MHGIDEFKELLRNEDKAELLTRHMLGGISLMSEELKRDPHAIERIDGPLATRLLNLTKELLTIYEAVH